MTYFGRLSLWMNHWLNPYVTCAARSCYYIRQSEPKNARSRVDDGKGGHLISPPARRYFYRGVNLVSIWRILSNPSKVDDKELLGVWLGLSSRQKLHSATAVVPASKRKSRGSGRLSWAEFYEGKDDKKPTWYSRLTIYILLQYYSNRYTYVTSPNIKDEWRHSNWVSTLRGSLSRKPWGNRELCPGKASSQVKKKEPLAPAACSFGLTSTANGSAASERIF